MSVSAFAAGTWAAQLVAAGLLVAGYGTVFVMLYRAARRRPGGHRVSIWHVLPFAVGVVLLVVAGAPPLSREADSLLVAHMLQHVLISDVAAALIVLGLRTPLLTLGLPRRTLRLMAPGSRLGAVIARMTSPVFAVAFFAVMQWTSAAPSVLEATQRSAAVHLVQHGLLLWSGMLLWWVVIDPLGRRRHQARAVRLLVVGASRIATVAVCLPLTFLDRSLYSSFDASAAARGFDGLTQQQVAGAAMCLVEILVFGVALAVVAVDVLSRDQRTAARRDPPITAGRDGRTG